MMRLLAWGLLCLLMGTVNCAAKTPLPAPIAAVLPKDAYIQYAERQIGTVDLVKLGQAPIVLYTLENRENYSGLVLLPQPDHTYKKTCLPTVPDGHYFTDIKAVLAADICKSGERALIVIQSTRQIGSTQDDGSFGIAYTYKNGQWTGHSNLPDGKLILDQSNAKGIRQALQKPAVCAALDQPDDFFEVDDTACQ